MRRDLESNANMGALAVEQLLLAAEASGDGATALAPPTLDMAAVEDEAALARMQRVTEQFRAGVAGVRGAGGAPKMVRAHAV